MTHLFMKRLRLWTCPFVELWWLIWWSEFDFIGGASLIS